MSKEALQTIVLLDVMAGICQTMLNERCFAKEDLQQTIHFIIAASTGARRKWPIMYSKSAAMTKRGEFIGLIETLQKEHYPAVELVKMCERIALDLIDLNPGGVRNDLVKVLPFATNILAEHVDADGANFQAYEESGKLIDQLYEIVGITEHSFS